MLSMELRSHIRLFTIPKPRRSNVMIPPRCWEEVNLAESQCKSICAGKLVLEEERKADSTNTDTSACETSLAGIRTHDSAKNSQMCSSYSVRLRKGPVEAKHPVKPGRYTGIRLSALICWEGGNQWQRRQRTQFKDSVP